MPPKPPNHPPRPLPGIPAQRGKLPSVTSEVDARPERQTREPTLTGIAPPAPGAVAPPQGAQGPNAWDPEDTGHRAADSLVLELAERTRVERELRQQLAEARAEAARKPPEVESVPPPPSRRRARAAKAASGLLMTLLGLAGGAGGPEALKAIRGTGESPVTQAQVADLRSDQAKTAAAIDELQRYLAAAYDDEDGFRLLMAAFACSQRRLLASGVDCSEVLSVVPVNPSPLTAAKPLPQLVIPGPRARKPEPRLPPKGR